MKFSATKLRAVLLAVVILAVAAAFSLLTPGATRAQTATPTATALAAPVLTATVAGADAIELGWTAVPGAARYELYTQLVAEPGWRQLDEGDLTDTTYRHRGLTAGAVYQYAVRAVDADGQPLGPWSNFPTATAPGSGSATLTATATPTATVTATPTSGPTPTPPPGPTPTATATASALAAPVLTAQAAGAAAIELGWTAVPGAARYALFTQLVAEPGWRQLDEGDLTDTTYRHRGLTAGAVYQYAVRAVDARGQPLGPWSNFPTATAPASGDPTATATPTPPPGPTPTSTATASALAAPVLTAQAAGADAIELNWTAVSGAARYALFTQLVAEPGWRQLDEGDLTDTTYRHRGLAAGATYQYAVRAVDARGQPLGPWSNFPTATAPGTGANTPTATPTPPPGPTPTATATASALAVPVLTAQAAGAAAIELNWTAVSGAARYALFTQLVAEPGWRQLDEGDLTDTTYRHRGLAAGAVYQYAVRAVDARGQPLGPWSNFPTATAPGTGANTPTATATATVATTERGALTALYQATNGDNWTYKGNWLSDKPLADWYRVDTDASGRVTVLRLSRNRLSGTLPDLSTLANLGALILEENQLTGTIPNLGALAKLHTLSLKHNDLSGPIPGLSNLTNLITLNLGNNQLSGPIPGLSNLTNLITLDLGNNQLSGPLPDLDNLAKLKTISLDDNQLTGPISVLANLASVRSINLAVNQLTGPIPDLANLTNLAGLILNQNQLSGPIPSLSNLNNLMALDLKNNQLSGSLPDLGNLANLEYLNLHDNQLSGPIPDLGNLANLISLTLSYNDLSGPIPDLSALSELTSLHLNNNRLSGPVPDLSALANLKYLSLHDNELTGPLPDLSVLPDLQSATFSGNQFCLLPGASLSHPNRNVNANLQRLNLPPCTGAELAAVPAAPQNLSATVAASQVTLRWDAAANAAGYDLWVWDSLDRQWGAIGGLLTSTTYNHPVLTDGRNYYFQVRVRNADGVTGLWSQRVQAIVVPQRFPPPPPSLRLHLYYQKYLNVNGVVIAAASEVSDEKMTQAGQIVAGILSAKPNLVEDPTGKYIRIAIYQRDEQGRTLSTLPEFRGRSSYLAGLFAPIPSGSIVVVPERDQYCGVLIHEFAHAIHDGHKNIPDAAYFGSRLRDLYTAALNAGLWLGVYATANFSEYWAETVKYWFWEYIEYPEEARGMKLEDYDPEIAKLIVEIFGEGAYVPEYCKP